MATAKRQRFYDKIDRVHLAPLWECFTDYVTHEPQSPAQPYLWRYEALRPYLMESGGLITAREAERRVLILENPGMRGQARITRSLYAGMQLVMPHEVAPCHRHSQSALRLMLEGKAYTGVGGERIEMAPGDFVITPPGAWHEHANDGDEPVVWLDGLDLPLVQLLDAGFAERHEQEVQPQTAPPGYSLARYGANMRPVGERPAALTSPVNHYPYARSREVLAAMSRQGDTDPHHGIKMEFLNPVTGDAAMPTMSTFIQWLPDGFTSARYRSSDGMVYAVLEGEGETVVGDTTLRWGPHDTFVVPSWQVHTHRTGSEAVLFSFSDRVVQQKLGLWREQKD